MAAGQRGRVLVVDDKERYRKSFLAKYRAEGYEVLAASSVPEAKRLIEQTQFDLIVTDLYFRKQGGLLSRPSGFALCRWCRERGIKSRVILQSTSFEHFWSGPMNFLVGRWAKKRGIETRRKNSALHKKP